MSFQGKLNKVPSFEEGVSLSTMDTEERDVEQAYVLPHLHYLPTWMWQENEESNMQQG